MIMWRIRKLKWAMAVKIFNPAGRVQGLTQTGVGSPDDGGERLARWAP